MVEPAVGEEVDPELGAETGRSVEKGPPEARKPQYEKIFTSRIDNTRKYSQLTKPIRENTHF